MEVQLAPITVFIGTHRRSPRRAISFGLSRETWSILFIAGALTKRFRRAPGDLILDSIHSEISVDDRHPTTDTQYCPLPFGSSPASAFPAGFSGKPSLTSCLSAVGSSPRSERRRSMTPGASPNPTSVETAWPSAPASPRAPRPSLSRPNPEEAL
jgi:hypothetical protein